MKSTRKPWMQKTLICYPLYVIRTLRRLCTRQVPLRQKKEYLERLGPLIQKFTPEKRRCLYENEDVMIIHFIMSLPNGTKDAALYYVQKEDGLMRKIETGSTSIK